MSKPPMSKVSQSCGYLWGLYTHNFWDPNAPPNTLEEEDISGWVTIVTGSNTGIGREIALQLAKRGAKVVMACRDLKKAETAKEYILGKIPDADLVILRLDLGSRASIHEFAQEFQSQFQSLDILVNNAGVMSTDGKFHKTEDGFEYHMGVNHLGPFLLAKLLLPIVNKERGKIVSVSSSQLVLARLDLNNFMTAMTEKGFQSGWDAMEPYNVSKLANALCMRRLAFLEAKSGDCPRFFQLCPGFVNSDVFRDDHGFGGFTRKAMRSVVGVEPELGCETAIFCSVNKNVGEGKGEMYRFCKLYEQGTSFLDPEDPKAIELYKISEKLLESS